jgi:hypothetical protein
VDLCSIICNVSFFLISLRVVDAFEHFYHSFVRKFCCERNLVSS